MQKIITLLASPRYLTYLLPWFMLLLVLGTVAQRYIGLVEAQRLFFSSWILWLGIIPTPGGITTLALITLNLMMKLIFESPWRKTQAGTIVTHFAVLLLMLGGGITWLVNQEGYIALAEGESTAQMQDYYTRELVITKNAKTVALWPEAALKKAQTLRHPALPFDIQIDDFCANCATFVQKNPQHKGGIARRILLQSAPPAKEKEDNKAGLTFNVKGTGYIAYELLPSQAPKIQGYRITLARQSLPLPFMVTLIDFEKIRYPGSDKAREYESLVEIQDGTKKWQQTISMNEPLRYRGYALYQSSFTRTNSAEISVLSVVKNDAWLLPYVATLLLAAGLLWQLWIRYKPLSPPFQIPISSVGAILVCLIFCLFPLTTRADATLPLHDFGAIPIAHEGRIKPLSVFARDQLKAISGDTVWHKKPAIEWLARMLFTPERMQKTHLIVLRSDVVREQLGLPPRATHRYGLSELQRAMQHHLAEVLSAVIAQQQEKPLTPLQASLAELYGRMQQFQQLQDSLAFLLPFPSAPHETYYNLAKRDPKQLTKNLRRIMAKMEQRGQMSHLLAVVPAVWQKDTDWYSLWQMRFNGKASPQTAELVTLWQQMANSWRNGQSSDWEAAVRKTTKLVQRLAEGQYHPNRLWLEEWYYRLSLLSLAIGGYLIFLILQAFIARKPGTERENQSFLYNKLAIIPLIAAITLHGLALLVRMLILGRPPVSNLYESVLFVSLLIACAGALSRKPVLMMGAAGMAAILLLISQSLLEGQEQLPVVMAVLNTDFWLATHVICITAGYAAAMMVSIVSHYQLFHISRFNTALDIPARDSKTLPLLALLLTAVGTLLGGIWADQSWGRFWGWDPKENGAMLIVLWLIWLIHGRLAGQFNQRWYLAGMAYLSVVVSLAWFGVNLLSVGLHSYGFTDGTALGLFIFIALETLIIGYLLWRNYRDKKMVHSHI